jgi:hypothetical protein
MARIPAAALGRADGARKLWAALFCMGSAGRGLKRLQNYLLVYFVIFSGNCSPNRIFFTPRGLKCTVDVDRSKRCRAEAGTQSSFFSKARVDTTVALGFPRIPRGRSREVEAS